MEKFIINSLCTIYGLGSASGIIYQNENLYLISDNSTYLFDLDENDNPVVKLKADGSIVKSKKTVGHAATLDEIFLSEMEAKNVLKKNNAKPEKVITFAPVNPDNGGVKIGSKAAQRIAEIQSGQA